LCVAAVVLPETVQGLRQHGRGELISIEVVVVAGQSRYYVLNGSDSGQSFATEFVFVIAPRQCALEAE
jgi:hypothetical protein